MLRTSNINEINQITSIPNPTNKRIQRECKEMIDKYDEITVEHTVDGHTFVSLKRKENNYIFNIPMYYPFTSPKLTINGLSQQQFFDLRSERFKKVLKYVSGLECMCCDSYLCKDNWSPGITMDIVISQIENYKNIKYWIFVKLIFDKIKEKYLNRDIDLDSWLFDVYDRNIFYPGKL